MKWQSCSWTRHSTSTLLSWKNFPSLSPNKYGRCTRDTCEPLRDHVWHPIKYSMLIDCQRATITNIRLLNTKIIAWAPKVIMIQFYHPFGRHEKRSWTVRHPFCFMLIVLRLPENFGSFRVALGISSELFRWLHKRSNYRPEMSGWNIKTE